MQSLKKNNKQAKKMTPYAQVIQYTTYLKHRQKKKSNRPKTTHKLKQFM